jgi:Domain of unknown function (DUF397)
MTDAPGGMPAAGRSPSGTRWAKSTHSGPTGGNCVEVAILGDGRVAVRNSRHPAGPALLFPRDQWSAFVAAIAGRRAPVRRGNPSSYRPRSGGAN